MSRYDDIPEVFRRAMEEAGWRGGDKEPPPPPPPPPGAPRGGPPARPARAIRGGRAAGSGCWSWA